MEHPGFFEKEGPFSIGEIAEACHAAPGDGCSFDKMIEDVRPIDLAGQNDISFIDNPKFLEKASTTNAAACFVADKYQDRLPQTTHSLISPAPYRSFAKVMQMFYPSALKPRYAYVREDEFTEGIHPTAILEENVIVEPNAVIGPDARIGQGTIICAGAVIGYRVNIGRDCFIGPNVNITSSLIGDRVNVHSGASLGQDGFGFAMGPKGHIKVPQIGRVIIQNDVEIGSNSTIDRGALDDTIIGEGTKIDNLVQIGHNVIVGRHCVLAGFTGIAGSTVLGDFVVMGGQSGAVGHVKIETGAQVAAATKVLTDIGPGGKWAGYPAIPFRTWAKKVAILKGLAEEKSKRNSRDDNE